MTAEHFPAPESAARTAAVARRLVTLAMTAAILSLAGCGDSGEDSETGASDTGRRASAADPAWHGVATTVTGSTRRSAGWGPAATARGEQLRH
ncbi:MAG: hypothetical protein ACLP4W_04940 [Mycobacterium sp.]|uniref:hypothetical protein n=1 Tax=Mycobacterium sp. TaxID=1785 RepID=UPI003F95DFBF